MAVSLPSAPEGEDRMTSFTTVQTAAMQRALRAAASPDAPPGPNPRVGCVILSPDGDILAEGHHRGAGTAHAEVDALANLAAAGASARGATVLVTLEPCNHQGRTGPCVQALLDAGVAEVIYAQDDPALTVRDEAGQPAPAHLQPLRVVVGSRSLPPTSRVLTDDHYLLLPDHDPRAVLAVLAEREIRHVLLEGGPTLATAFLRAGLVDQVVAYTAPALLGAGAAALADFGAATITDALRLSHPRVEVLGAGDELAVRFCGDLEADDVPPAHFHTEESH